MKYKNFLRRGHTPSLDATPLGVFGARPPVPLSDGLDTRPCKILDTGLLREIRVIFVTFCIK